MNTLSELIYKSIETIIKQKDSMDISDTIKNIKHLFDTLIIESTSSENIPFTTLFSRYAFAMYKFSFSSKEKFYCYKFRDLYNKTTLAPHLQLTLGFSSLIFAVQKITNEAPPNLLDNYSNKYPPIEPNKIEKISYHKKLKIVIVKNDIENERLIGYNEKYGSQTITIRYDNDSNNDDLFASIDLITNRKLLPITINLLKVEETTNFELVAKAIIFEPDILFNVTAIASCFQSDVAESRFYFLKKFMPHSNSKHLIIGNIANFFLDELLLDNTVRFKDLFKNVFHIAPLSFALMNDQQTKELYNDCLVHFTTIKKMVDSEFEKQGIYKKNIFIEPSFYAPKYGFQGRLDLLHVDGNDSNHNCIVELKSGKSYKPNKYGLNQDHYIQTLCYDLLVEEVIESKTEIGKFILYSQNAESPLKHAPRIASHQHNAINIRNKIVVIERMMSRSNSNHNEVSKIIKSISTSQMSKFKGFTGANIMQFEKVFGQLTALEYKYVCSYIGFIAREMEMAKIGSTGYNGRNGAASLWVSNEDEKIEKYEILTFLKINDASNVGSKDPNIELLKSENSNQLANFRVGDLAVLYPKVNDKNATHFQVHKGTVISIQNDSILFRLRNRQTNPSIFNSHNYWNLEKDSMDSGFDMMYKSMFEWAMQPPQKRSAILGLTYPDSSPSETKEINFRNTTTEQQGILNKMIHSNDYFLLWGPPGTGKTKVMVKNYVEYFINNSDENILLLAYTNRAVDELCHAIEEINMPNQKIKDVYFRIGSKYSTSPDFSNQLLNHKISSINNRKKLVTLIKNHRIVVATISSLRTQTDLFDLMSFNRVVIDEASQILEPLLVGLLSRFKHYVLIGDHLQLPAVVAQNKELSIVNDDELNSLGLLNLGDSYFERMFKILKKNNQNSNYAMLSYQGRMHQDIVKFPSLHFYNDSLKILPNNLLPSQCEELSESQYFSAVYQI